MSVIAPDTVVDMATASLLALPEELIGMILEYLFQVDIERLSLISKSYYRRFYGYTRRELVIQYNGIGQIDGSVDIPAPASFPEIEDCTAVQPWSLTRSLELNAPIRQHFGTLCVDTSETSHNIGKKDHHRRVLQRLSEDVGSLLSHLSDDSLHAFRWHVGCCVPESILGPSGYIPMKQPSISTLSLITSQTCRQAASLKGMTRLRRLKAFSWQGVSSAKDLETFRSVVRNNADTLVSLEVRVLDGVENRLRREDSILERLGILLPPGNGAPDQKYLLGLRHLSLRRAYLGEWSAEQHFAFRLESLQSLDLVNCHGTTRFFESLLNSGLHLNLRSLKVTITEAEWGVHMFPSSPLGRVLASFSGLEELVILTSSQSGYDYRDEDNPKVIRRLDQTLPVASHAETLKRLVYQIHRTGDGDGLYVEGYDWTIRSTFPVRKLLESLPRLECLGLWILPMMLKRDIESAAGFHSLKLLHFRMDGKRSAADAVQQLVNAGYPPELIPGPVSQGRKYEKQRTMQAGYDAVALPELVEFATWAFGPAGFPNLELIACGNFSSEACQGSRVLLRRDLSGGQRSGFLSQWLQTWPGRILGSGGPSGNDQREYPNPFPFKLIHPDSVYPVGEIEGAWDFLRESRVGHPVRAVPSLDSGPSAIR